MEDDFVDLLSRLPVFDLTDVRAFRAAVDAVRPAREMQVHPGLVVRHVMVPGLGAAPPVRVRLYTPRTTRRPLAGLVYCHGGGFVLGSLDSDHERCVRLAAEAGVVVASPDYRLAPEHRYPAGLDDCEAVLSWLHAEADQLGVDRTRLALGGTSAGAALAAGTALRLRDQAGPAVSLLLLVCPVTDDEVTSPSMREFWDCTGWNGAATELMWRHYLPLNGPAPYAAPNRASSLRDLPATYLVVADHDPLRDQGLEFGQRLARDGVQVTVRHYSGVPHGFDSLLPRAPISVQAVDDQVRALAELAARPAASTRSITFTEA
jgi:acetyl esterase/lipase